MRPATAPRDDRSDTRLLAVDRHSGAVRDVQCHRAGAGRGMIRMAG